MNAFPLHSSKQTTQCTRTAMAGNASMNQFVKKIPLILPLSAAYSISVHDIRTLLL